MEKIILISQIILDFFNNDFVIAVTLLFLTNVWVNRIIPNKKQRVVEKIVQIKNLLKEVEFLYDRIVNTARRINKEIKNHPAKEKQYFEDFNKALPTETTRISNIVNEKIQLSKDKLDSELEIYFKDHELHEAHETYSEKLKAAHKFISEDLLKNSQKGPKKLSELEDGKFSTLIDNLKIAELHLIKKVTKSKSISFRNK